MPSARMKQFIWNKMFRAVIIGMMEAVRTSETSVDNHFTRQYNPEDSSEHHTHRRENLKSHIIWNTFLLNYIFKVFFFFFTN
jgi:hypothetical protein